VQRPRAMYHAGSGRSGVGVGTVVDQSIARGREATWQPAGGRRPAWAWPDSLRGLARPIGERLRAWALADVGPGRLVPWIAIGFGLGIILYFTADREPQPWAAAAVFVAALVGAILARNRAIAFPLVLALAAASAGFLTATAKRAIIAHPVLQAAAWNVDIAGFVEAREERERSDRIVVRVHRISGTRLDQPPERVRVSVRKGTAPPVASFVEFKARLSPPLEPLRPGGYDFARNLYFQGIGASGFVLGRIRTVEPPLLPGLKLRAAAAIDAMRDALDRRIRSVLTGDRGAIASALITGKRDAISTPLNDAMFVSGLGHVLSISGYHMAVVAGVIFFVLRALFALMPATAGHFPVKKWAAVAALAASAFYLVLSGAEVATQRSFIMIAIVLIGVMVDRPAITLRTLTAAAIVVLLFTPEAIVHPSFQMSFAATLAMVAGYERGLSWMSAARDTPRGVQIALWGGRWFVGLMIVSLLAGLATTLFAAYHFHRLAPYGVIANLIAMPVVSGLVMPMGILGVLLMPFGLDGFAWYLMGLGIDWNDRHRALGREPARRGRPDGGIRDRAVVVGQRRAGGAVPAQVAVAPRRRGLTGIREPVGGAHPAAGRADRRRRPDFRRAWFGWPARHRTRRQRYLRRPAVARRRCRCAVAYRREPRRRHSL
jgi:competence protein ComEC